MSSLLNDVEKKMQGCVNALKKDYANMRASRANPAILDKIVVEYYGSSTPISQVAAVSVPEAKTIVIQPWDMSILGAIEKAIQKSDIGINPNNDGKVIRLVMPALSEERRKELKKEVSKRKEEAKVGIRNIRQDAFKKLKTQKKDSEINDDELKSKENKIQKLVHDYEEEIEKIAAEKSREIMSV